MRIDEEPTPEILMSNALAHDFDPILMRYLPELVRFEAKSNSVYPKLDYMSLVVKASILNGYAEGTGGVSRKLLGSGKGSRTSPTGETALSHFRSIDRHELLGATSMVFEEQVNELKRKGLLNRPFPIAFDWHDQLFYGEHDSAEMVHGISSKNGSSVRTSTSRRASWSTGGG